MELQRKWLAELTRAELEELKRNLKPTLVLAGQNTLQSEVDEALESFEAWGE